MSATTIFPVRLSLPAARAWCDPAHPGRYSDGRPGPARAFDTAGGERTILEHICGRSMPRGSIYIENRQRPSSPSRRASKPPSGAASSGRAGARRSRRVVRGRGATGAPPHFEQLAALGRHDNSLVALPD
jgi:hypothetical protein